MPGIQPTYGIVETGRNVRAFTKAHSKILWAILNPLLPWIIGLNVMDIIGNVLFPSLDGDFALGSLISMYFYTCFIISWHRILLHGPEKTVPMNPFKPERTDLAFIFMGVGLGISFVILAILSGALILLGPIGAILFVMLLLGLMYCFYKFCFYFPAKAVRSHLSLKESFQRTNGYVWKLLCAPFFALWRLGLIYFAYMITMILLAMALGMAFGLEKGEPAPPLFWVMMGLLYMPNALYFIPMMYAYGVGVLSNYYQHSLQIGPPNKD